MDDWEDLEPDPALDSSDTEDVRRPPEAEPQAEEPTSNDDVSAFGVHIDEPVCRICFGTAEEADLGRLISPCLCRGTVAKVHIQCLNQWRTVSRGSSSFFQCDQCKYQYRVKRARIAGLAENKYALAALSGMFFLFVVFVNGHLANWLLQQGRSRDSLVSYLFFQGPDPAYDSYGSWTYSSSYLSFEAVGQAVNLAKTAAEKASLTKRIDDGDIRSDVQPKPGEAGLSYRMIGTRRKSRRKRYFSRFANAISHFTLGISMTGIGSFFWMMMSLPLMPLHPLRNGLLRTVRSTRDERGRINKFGAVLVVLFIAVGVVKSLHLCWRITHRSAKYLLKRAETGILEVHV